MKLLLLFVALFFQGLIMVRAQNVVFEKEDPKADSIWAAKRDVFVDSKVGKPFPLKDSVRTVDGKVFDFGLLNHSTVVCFGFYGCHPCMRELPAFVEASKSHPDVDFVYITFDAEKERQREFEEVGLKDFKPTLNYHVIHLDRREIDQLKLTNGYPTKYLIGKDGKVIKAQYSFKMNSEKTLLELIEEFIAVQ
jgi:thiol-disulfide isomerase/thioredoxin